ncbi:MAG: substrate-binding domain-containing protein [Solirubrobacteraceae bacterium]
MRTATAFLATAGFATLLLFPPGAARAAERELRLATTPSVQDSGLLEALLPELAKDTGLKVQVIAVPTAETLRLGAEGKVDVVLSPAPLAEQERLKAKVFLGRYALMQTWFLIAGPGDDTAMVRDATNGADAFRRIASAKAPYVSRGDDSETHARERALLKAAGLDANGGWPGFSRADAGMEKTLLLAGEKKAYALSDLPTFLASQKRTGLVRLTKASEDLAEVYALLPVNPEKFPGKIHAEAASAFVEWCLRATSARAIADFKQPEYGEPLFRPSNLDDE